MTCYFQNVHVPLVYECGDAAGQNGTTAVTWALMQAITAWAKDELPEIEITKHIIEAAASGDKHPSPIYEVLGMYFIN